MKLDSFHQYFADESTQDILNAFNTRLMQEVGQGEEIKAGAVSVWYKNPLASEWIYHSTVEGNQDALESGFESIVQGVNGNDVIITSGVTTIIE